jgi:hypothetical protein
VLVEQRWDRLAAAEFSRNRLVSRGVVVTATEQSHSERSFKNKEVCVMMRVRLWECSG